MKNTRTYRMIAAALLMLSLFCAIDLGLNVLYNAEPSLHDGSFTTCSVLHGLFGIFGDSLWYFERFFHAFQSAAWVTFALLAVNVVLFFHKDKKTH